MRRAIADAIYGAVFPRNRVHRYSYPLWRALPLWLVTWVSDHYSPEPRP